LDNNYFGLKYCLLAITLIKLHYKDRIIIKEVIVMVELSELYQKLYDYTKEQKVCIEENKFDELIKVLEKKDEIINEIDENNLKDYLKSKEEPKEIHQNLKEIMEDIKELEEKNEKNLREKKKNLSKEMKSFNKKQKSRDGYKKGNAFEAKFIDKKS